MGWPPPGDAAAGAAHDLDEVIVLFAAADAVEHLLRVGSAMRHGDVQLQAAQLQAGLLHALQAANGISNSTFSRVLPVSTS